MTSFTKRPAHRQLFISLIALVLTVSLSESAVAQQCTVIAVWASPKGTAKTTTGEMLAMGHPLLPTDTLDFTGNEAVRIRALCEGMPYVFKRPDADQNPDRQASESVLSEQIRYTRNDLLQEKPIVVRDGGRISIRSERALKQHFDGSYLLLGTHRLHVRIDDYPLRRGGSFGFIIPTPVGERYIEIPAEGNDLFLAAGLFTDSTGVPFPADALTASQLYYRNARGRVRLLTTVPLVIPDQEELVEEVGKLISILVAEGVTEEIDRFNEVRVYLAWTHGAVYDPALKAWLSRYLDKS